MFNTIKTGYCQWTGTIGKDSFIIKRRGFRRWIIILNGEVSPEISSRRTAVALLCRSLETN